MSDTRTEKFNLLLWPAMLATFACAFPFTKVGYNPVTMETEQWILYALTAFVTLTHLHYGTAVVSMHCLNVIYKTINFLSLRFAKCVITSGFVALK